MSLTEATIQKAPQVTNACHERELDLRGVGLKHIDDTALAKVAEEFDTINLCDNQLTTLDVFPKSERLTTLMLHKNGLLVSIGMGVTVRVPNVHTVVANNCGFASLSSLNFLAGWKKIQRVSFSRCPVYENLDQLLFTARKTGGVVNGVELPESLKQIDGFSVVRLYIIAVCDAFSATGEGLKLIDFERVLDSERESAKKFKADLLALPQIVFKMQNTASVSSSAVAAGAGTSSSALPPQFAADGTRIRKRGRETAATAVTCVASPSDSAGAAGDGSAPAAAAANSSSLLTADPLDSITQEELDRREAELNERVNNASTDEEFAAIELEMDILDKLKNDFVARQAKRSRGERR